ncbi:hypothetical protein EV363DRAFT_1452533 [Boletus edulis]|uniref:Uncharacterized protein n=1 Tax=Boletus edulis BED1 TaxID=1328754 RepID=A0AAD4BGW2_BOLED|nr:hypothetical protein EV363DRAFT_1452533 [Boletus edulis]KAF8430560.1 hypothetical protein L210DRAFT_3651780 [Boletus edulis BED1]
MSVPWRNTTERRFQYVFQRGANIVFRSVDGDGTPFVTTVDHLKLCLAYSAEIRLKVVQEALSPQPVGYDTIASIFNAEPNIRQEFATLGTDGRWLPTYNPDPDLAFIVSKNLCCPDSTGPDPQLREIGELYVDQRLRVNRRKLEEKERKGRRTDKSAALREYHEFRGRGCTRGRGQGHRIGDRDRAREGSQLRGGQGPWENEERAFPDSSSATEQHSESSYLTSPQHSYLPVSPNPYFSGAGVELRLTYHNPMVTPAELEPARDQIMDDSENLGTLKDADGIPEFGPDVKRPEPT